ncbi:quinic acid utilization activator [Fusarium heterosporum]|uniref:Quinic acid utilization activator n=1 Tax=Fusarium heterosporum TaxID=42747 RepID=A0A8H5WM64_FUSHE|nr:quinic acid utilization activator [Fusarium heterosporum]
MEPRLPRTRLTEGGKDQRLTVFALALAREKLVRSIWKEGWSSKTYQRKAGSWNHSTTSLLPMQQHVNELLQQNSQRPTEQQSTRQGCPETKEVGQLLASGGVEEDEDGTDSTQYFDLKIAEALAISLTSKNDNLGVPLTPMNTGSTPQDISLFGTTTSPAAADPTSDCVKSPPQASLDQRPEPIVSRSVNVPPTSVAQLPEQWPFLLDLYFESTHSWLPISQKHELLRAAYTLANNASATSINPPSSGELAFLHAVLLYSSHQSTLLPNKLKPQTDNAYSLITSHDLIETTLFGDPNTYCLGHVRAFIVLSLFEMERKVWTSAWAHIARAIYTVICMGLMDKPSSAGAILTYDDSVRRTLMGCAVLETIISARLKTIPYFQSPQISYIGPLTTDGMEEWETWQPKVFLGAEPVKNPRPHIPGHVISSFNNLLQIIAPLNDLSSPRRISASEGRLHEIMHASYQNIGELGEQRPALDVPPQTLCLWVASVAAMETAATELLLSYGSSSGRPEGYMANVKWLTSLVAERYQVLGCCSVPVAVEACFALLQKSLARQQLLYVGSDIENEFILLHKSISALLGLLKNPNDIPIQFDIAHNFQGHSINMADKSLQSTQPPSITIHPLPQANITPEVVSETMDIGRSSKTIDLTMFQNESPVATISQPPRLSIDSALLPAGSILGDEMDDDGLFDSLATLDSTDWTANPPEFMQHLGYMENQANDLESIFDLGF